MTVSSHTHLAEAGSWPGDRGGRCVVTIVDPQRRRSRATQRLIHSVTALSIATVVNSVAIVLVVCRGGR